MMWFSLAKLGFKAGSEIYKKRQETKILMAEAERTNAEKMARGELAYTQQIHQAQREIGKMNFALSLFQFPCCCWLGQFSATILIFNRR